MAWTESDDVEGYLAAAGPLLLADPALHTVALTVVENVRAEPDGTRFAWWTDAVGQVTGAVSRTPPYPVLLSVVPEEAVRPLALLWLTAGGSVNGPTALAVQVAAVAAQLSGRSVVLRSAERLHRLRQLHLPQGSGRLRPATEQDLDLVTAWFDAFVHETGGQPPADTRSSVRQRLAYGGLWLWEHGGRPVAMAGRTRTAGGVVRLGPVYTPPPNRGRGFGGAATAGVCRQALLAGAREVVLFTDLTNPTSNALYARLGFEPVADRAVLALG